MLILPALILVIFFALLITAVLRPSTRTAAILSCYLLIYANIVLVGEMTNSFLQLNNPWLWIGFHGMLTLVAVGIWLRAGRPSLKAPWVESTGRILPAGWGTSFKQWPELWVFGLGVVIIFAFSAVLIWIVPPNNNDSLSTHMSRVAYWLQRGAFFPWPSQRIWQITYPVNMQLQIFWTILFLRNDRIVEIVQWFGALAAVAAVFGLGRLLGATRPQALFAAFLLATFPEIILESTTTQNDLVAGTLFVILIYFLFLGLSQLQQGAPGWEKSLAMSGLALGLGIGTKQTLLFLLPGLGLALILIGYWGGKKVFRGLFFWGITGVVAFIGLGLYMFVVNQVNFGNPMGPESVVSSQTGGKDHRALVENLVFNTFRLAYQSIDPTGLPDPLTGYSFKLKGLITQKITDAVHFPVEAPIAVAKGHQFHLRDRYVMQEDAAWYGPLFAFLVLPAMFFQFMRGIKKKDGFRVTIFLLGGSFLLVDAALRPGWDAFQGRYFIPTVMVAVPTAAFLFQPGKRWAAARWIIAALALVIAANTFSLNTAKPLSGERNVWATNRLDQMTFQSFFLRKPVLMVDAKVPADATLGMLTFGSFQEYPFFREDFSRRLVQIYPTEQMQNIEWLKSQGIEFVLVGPTMDGSVVSMPKALQPVSQVDGWSLYTWKTGN